MAENGELICDDSVSPSPAVTPRQSMAEVDSSKQTGGEVTSPAKSSTQDLKANAEQAEAETDTKGSSMCSYTQPSNLIYPSMSNDFCRRPVIVPTEWGGLTDKMF